METMVQLSNKVAAAYLDFTWLSLLTLPLAKVEQRTVQGQPWAAAQSINMAAGGHLWTSLQQAGAPSAVMPRLCLIK